MDLLEEIFAALDEVFDDDFDFAVAEGGDGHMENRGGMVGFLGGYVQNGDTNPDPIYNPIDGQMAYLGPSSDDSTLDTQATSSDQPRSTTGVSHSQEVASLPVSGQSLASGGNPYVIQGDTEGNGHPHPSLRASPQTDEGDAQMVNGNAPTLDAKLKRASRKAPATVQWLMDNCETAGGEILPSSTLYNHYLRHCTDNKLRPVNNRYFGKLVHCVFRGLRKCRLRSRGSREYHYYGIQMKNLAGGQEKDAQAKTQQSQQQQQNHGIYNQHGTTASFSARK